MVSHTKRHTFNRRSTYSKLSLTGTAIISAVVGSMLLQSSFADINHNPWGYLDSCSLSGTTTTVYGWAHDPDTTTPSLPQVSVTIPGSGSQTRNSDIANYRTAPINKYLTDRNVPTGSTYGFSASFSNLYKGTTYRPSGTVFNVGAGANINLPVNGIGSVESSGKPYFANGIIPDACLAVKVVAPPPTPPPPTPTPTPTPPTPAPQPTPTPSPSPVVKPNPSPNPTPATPPARTPTPSPSPTPAPTPVATSIVFPNTTTSSVDTSATSYGATLTVRNSSAASVKVNYGTQPETLSASSSSATLADGQAVISLAELTPATTYYYQVVSTAANGQTETTTQAQFETLGNTISVTLKLGSQPLKDIAVIIQALDIQATTNASGEATLLDVPNGSYSLQYTYKGVDYTQSFTTEGATNRQGMAYVSVSIDVAKATGQAQTKSSSPKTTKVVIGLGLLGLAAIITIVLLILRRKKRDPADTYDYVADISQTVKPVVVPPAHPNDSTIQVEPGEVLPEHAGQSLKYLVLKAMQDEVKRRNDAKKD